MEAKRYSRQREAILKNLQHRTDHPSADMVYESMRREIPNISLGTVYRNLNTLAENGSIIRFAVGGKEHFDGNITPHIHFVCTHCGAIRDLFHSCVDDFIHEASDLLHCTVSGANLVFQGKCNICPQLQ
ncbi:MAG: transcriptional repressor [Clostridia bacterium]|nr:transcriptional repressor [Clostridia bacterium]